MSNFLDLLLFNLIFLRCSKYHHLALQLSCLALNDLFLLQEKRTEKAGLLLDTTDIIVKSSALNNNGSIEVIKTDQIGNINWQSYWKWVYHSNHGHCFGICLLT